MSRLRALGINIGDFLPGRQNAITDIRGVSVGHADIRAANLRTGITAVVPYVPDIAERKLFIGRFAVDGGDAMSGLGVAEDFGTFSSPIVLAPAPVVGRVYEALISYGLARDPGLGTETGWPPVVVGVDDTAYNEPALTYEQLTQAHVYEALANARADKVVMGDAGIGGGLQAFGYKGGVGTASRMAGDYTTGVLLAVNGGRAGALRIGGYSLPAGSEPDGPDTFVAIVATDAPLIPRQLERLAGRAVLGLAAAGLWGPYTREGLVLAFSTTGIVQQERRGPTIDVLSVDEEGLYPLFASAAFAAEEAVFDGLLAAVETERLKALPREGWPEAVCAMLQNTR
jgi:D-aminopeptidase